MFTSALWIKGEAYQARAAARRLGLGRPFYKLKGETIEFGPKKGTPREISVLRVPLSDHVDYRLHMRQIETRLGQHLTFLSTERRRYGDGISIDLSVGMSVGDEKYFVRTFCASAALMSQLVALGIQLSLSAYPHSDCAERRHLKWSDGIGRMPGLGK